jgi:hypothetical protein
MNYFFCTRLFSFELQNVEALNREAAFLGTPLAFVKQAAKSTHRQPQDGGYDVRARAHPFSGKGG